MPDKDPSKNELLPNLHAGREGILRKVSAAAKAGHKFRSSTLSSLDAESRRVYNEHDLDNDGQVSSDNELATYQRNGKECIALGLEAD